MKKLILFCLLLVSTFSINAQGSKPTKEQTLDYLTKTLKLTLGEEYSFRGKIKRYSKVDFKYDTVSEKIEWHDGFDECENTEIKWETVTDYNFEEYGSEKLILIIISFDSKYKLICKSKDFSSVGYTSYENSLNLLILKSKAESFKKALERLVEIAKEENKNPFEK